VNATGVVLVSSTNRERSISCRFISNGLLDRLPDGVLNSSAVSTFEYFFVWFYHNSTVVDVHVRCMQSHGIRTRLMAGSGTPVKYLVIKPKVYFNWRLKLIGVPKIGH